MPKKPKDKAWDAISQYIRVKECLEATKIPFSGVCFTCQRHFHINALEAGHYVSGRRNAVLFEENGIHNQCWWCNRALHGNSQKYKKRMIEKYGQKEVKRLEALKHKTILNRDMDFEGIEKKYKQKVKDILHQNGFKTWCELLLQS